MAQGAFGPAEASFRYAAQVAPDDFEAHYGLALALSAQSKTDESIQALRRALDLNPRLATGYVLLASLHQRRGEFAEAIRASRAAIDLNPGLSRPYVDVVHSKKIGTEDSDLVDRLGQMANEAGRSTGERIGLHYALGKSLNDLRQFEAAIRHFDAANELGYEAVGASLGYAPSDEEQAIDQVVRCFDAEFFRRNANLGSPSELPVMIVGMIRSGTTLLNAMLSSHPGVASAGELEFWESEALPLLRNAYRGVVHPSQIAEVADRYRRKLRAVGLKRKRVIDKMPVNYLHIGLIHTAFPNARFVHVRRNPIDTCLSIYTTDFGLEPPRFAFRRANIVHAYRQYRRLMEHWRRVIPADRLIEVDYEDLVRRREEVLPALVEFLGLDWDDSPLRHEDSSSEIVTPSRWQARQPVYTSSLERWRNYEPWLGEFAELG